MPKRLLITGFDPFGGQSVNPAWEAVSRLPARVGDCVVHALQVPTVFGLAAQRAIEEAQALHPDVILCVGQAGGRAGIGREPEITTAVDRPGDGAGPPRCRGGPVVRAGDYLPPASFSRSAASASSVARVPAGSSA